MSKTTIPQKPCQKMQGEPKPPKNQNPKIQSTLNPRSNILCFPEVVEGGGGIQKKFGIFSIKVEIQREGKKFAPKDESKQELLEPEMVSGYISWFQSCLASNHASRYISCFQSCLALHLLIPIMSLVPIIWCILAGASWFFHLGLNGNFSPLRINLIFLLLSKHFYQQCILLISNVLGICLRCLIALGDKFFIWEFGDIYV